MVSADNPRIVRLEAPSASPRLGRLGAPTPSPVLAVAGTTTEIDGELAADLLRQLRRACSAAAGAGAVIVTGGTDAGVFHLLGLALSSSDPRPPAVIGVLPARHVATDAQPAGESTFDLASEHTGFVLVPGTWGDETPVISRLVSAVADGQSEVMLLAGGGDGSALELVEHLRRGRPVVVLEGSGRLADEVVALVRHPGREVSAGLPADLGPLLATGTVSIIGKRSDRRLERSLRGLLRPPRRPLRQRLPVLTVYPRRRALSGASWLVDPKVAAEHPRLADRIHQLDSVVLPAFSALDAEANREQNRHRWFTILAISGGLLTTVFGAVEVWLRSVPWPGIIVATLGAATSAVTTLARRQGSLQTWLDARIRAERLRSIYFEALAGQEPAGDEPLTVRLGRRVADIRYGSSRP